jgi:hypothetical protein
VLQLSIYDCVCCSCHGRMVLQLFSVPFVMHCNFRGAEQRVACCGYSKRRTCGCTCCFSAEPQLWLQPHTCDSMLLRCSLVTEHHGSIHIIHSVAECVHQLW